MPRTRDEGRIPDTGDAGDAVLVTIADCPAGGDAAVHSVVDAVLDALAERAEPARYCAAWVLLRVDHRPHALLELALPLSGPSVKDTLRDLLATGPDSGPDSAPPSGGGPQRLAADAESISVVVPTVVGRVDELDACLSSLEALDHPSVELLLVDNRPVVPAPGDDPLPGLLARHPGVRAIREPRRGISAARNTGARAASGRIVAFTDDDVVVDPGWLTAFARRFAAHPDELAVTGLVVPAELETPAQRQYEAHYGGFGGQRTFEPVSIRTVASAPPWRAAQAVVRGDDGGVRASMPVYGIGAYGAGANMAFRRSELLAAGGFDLLLGTGTPSRGGEDLAVLVDVLWRGAAIGYEPAALVHHTHRRDQAGFEHQLRGNGIGYTAMLTSLVAADARHALALGVLVPAALLRMARQSTRRLLRRSGSPAVPGQRPDSPVAAQAHRSPARLVALELSGLPLGPTAYLRSRRAGGPVRSPREPEVLA